MTRGWSGRTRSRTLFVVSGLCAVTAAPFSDAADAPTTSAPPPVVLPSTLPRLRRAWAVSGLTATQWRYKETAPAFDGALFAVNASGARHLVAIDLATGKERWRVPQSLNPEPQIEFATGMVLRNSNPSGKTEALDVKTGKSLWTSKLCNFSNHVLDNGAVGFALCHGPWNTTHSSNGSSYSSETTILIAFNLANGQELWRRADWIGPNVVVGARQLFVQRKGTLIGLDPPTGGDALQIPLPPPGSGLVQPWHVVAADIGGKPVALVNGGGDGLLTNRLVSLGLPSGGELWSRWYPQERLKDVRGAIPHAGRLLEDGAEGIREVDVATGKTVLECPLPRIDAVNNYPKRWRLMRGEVVVMMDAGNENPPVVIRCGKPPGKPTATQLPRPATAGFWKLVAAEDGVIVMRVGDELVGYQVFDTEPPEQVALSPIDRVRAILDRAYSHPGGAITHNPPLHAELRAVPDVNRHLMAIIKQADATRRERAVDAATALRIPGVVDLLLGEIFRAPAVPRTFTEQEVIDHMGRDRVDPPSRAYAQALSRRSAQIVLLAAMDDAKAATRLGPLLLARATPEALGWWDWNIWGSWNAQGYGMGAWDGASRRERRARRLLSSGATGHSETLPAATGRPEAHAAIYRLLARLGRPADVARLGELDRATARGGGWAAICDADDAVKEPGPARLWVDPWGLCRGIDVGEYRVTQSRNIVWLRRRLADGSYGPPAWANDPGGDQCNDQRRMQTATLRVDGHVIVRGTHRHDEDVILSNIDSAAVFRDSDGDGLTDKTEAAFRTDPKRADTDGDGVPDGSDPAPLAKPVSDTGGEAAAEMLRYATLFLVGGPLTWQGDRAAWGESPSSVGLILHLPTETLADEQVCESARIRIRREADRPLGVRTPFPVASVESLTITGDRAQGRFAWSERGGRHAHDLGLARVRGKWRVVDDRPSGN